MELKVSQPSTLIATRRRRFWIGLFIISIIPAFAFAFSLGYLDWLPEVYESFYSGTIGEPYTVLFRRQPLLFAVPVGVIVGLAYWRFPRQYLGRGIMMFLTFMVAFVAGHVFW